MSIGATQNFIRAKISSVKVANVRYIHSTRFGSVNVRKYFKTFTGKNNIMKARSARCSLDIQTIEDRLTDS